jgi:hypothetical protein
LHFEGRLRALPPPERLGRRYAAVRTGWYARHLPAPPHVVAAE